MAPLHGPIIAIVPARNSARIGDTVAALAQTGRLDQIVVVDDGSEDDTVDRSLNAGATVVRLPTNRGKGGALEAALREFPDARVYLLVDADLAETAAHTVKLLNPVLDGSADLAIASFPSAGGKGGFGIIKRCAGWIIHRQCGFSAQEPLSGQRAVRGDVLRGLSIAPRFGVEVAMTIDAVRSGSRVVEMALPLDHEHTGRSWRGFSHRGAQAVDILRSLVGRPGARGSRWAVAAALMAVALVAGVSAASETGLLGSTTSGSRPVGPSVAGNGQKIILATVTNTSLADLDRGVLPNIAALMSSTGGALTPRISAPVQDQRSAFASLGAGAPVLIGRDGGVVSKRSSFGTLGALGDALQSASIGTAYVGARSGESAASTPGVLAIADSAGNVGSLSAGSLPAHPESGLGAAMASRSQAVTDALTSAGVVLVDLGGSQEPWPSSFGSMSDEVREQRHLRRLDQVRVADAMVGRLLNDHPEALLIVVGVSPASHWRLTPLAVSGGATGTLWSPSTRSPGLSVLTDIAPTVLFALGVPVPSAMVGQRLSAGPAPADLAAVRELHERTIRREALAGSLTLALIVLLAGVYLSTLVSLGCRRRVVLVTEWMALACASVPVVSFAYRLAPVSWQHPAVAASGIALGSALLTTFARRFRRFPLSPLIVIAAVTTVVMAFDAATAGSLQNLSLLGYTPLTASRYYGMGNFGFAVFGSAAILLAGSWVASHPSRRDGALHGILLLGAVTVLETAPSMGADFGGALVLVPILLLATVVWWGARITLRSVAAASMFLITAIATLGLVDAHLAQGSHVGRFLQSGWSGMAEVIGRKADSSLRVLAVSNWLWVLVGFLVCAFGAAWFSRRRFTWFATAPLWRSSAMLLAVFAVLGGVLNDSGIAVTAMVSIYGGALLVLLARRTPFTRPTLLEPHPGALLR